jgi:hypothetical protein
MFRLENRALKDNKNRVGHDKKEAVSFHGTLHTEYTTPYPAK